MKEFEGNMSKERTILQVGIDVGSTTTKIAALDVKSRRVIYSDYQRHHADQIKSVSDALWKLYGRFPDAQFHLALTGSGAKRLGDALGVPYVQEVVANSIALKEDFPQPRENDYPQRIAVLNVLPDYLEDQNCSYHEHIHGCTESSWAFQGLLTCLGGEGTWNVTPLPLSPMYYHWNQATNRPETFDVLYWYDGQTIFPVALEQTGEHQFRLTDSQVRGELSRGVKKLSEKYTAVIEVDHSYVEQREHS